MNSILFGDCLQTIPQLISQGIKVQTCVTSPPYFGLRDYGHDGQLGFEQTPEEYVANMVKVFRLVRELLAGTGDKGDYKDPKYANGRNAQSKSITKKLEGFKSKDLIGIPWRVAFALQADGWYLRQDIIWNKPNPMPEPVKDRCTKAHEYIFLMSKSSRYFFDTEAAKEEAVGGGTRNRRSVWSVATKPFKGAHFATFPTALIEPCILAGSRVGDVVFDPFMGSGTTAATALSLGRRYCGCEVNPEYGPLQQKRITAAKGNLTLGTRPVSATTDIKKAGIIEQFDLI